MATPDAALVAGPPIPRLRERPHLGRALALSRDPLAAYQRVARERGEIGGYPIRRRTTVMCSQ